MKPAKLMSWSIRKLHLHLLEKRFAIPKLQRNFVWDGNRAASLLDSVLREIPIGSLFLWEMSQKSAHLIRQSATVLPPFAKNNKRIWFVIDGQQRLSVIYQALQGEAKVNDAGRDIDFGRLCFVVNPDTADAFAKRIVYRKPVFREFVPVCDILAPDWKRRIGKHPIAVMKKIRNCRERLLRFKLPIVKIESATLDEIGEVFTRVNSLGMKVTSADRAIALMGKLDVHAIADELRYKLREANFELGSVDPILMGFNLVTEELQPEGDPPKLERMARRWSQRIENDDSSRKEFEAIWHRYQDAALRTVEYLRQRFPVHDESFLPSVNMLSTLSVFFFHHPSPPNGRQAREIRKWFWVTGVAKRYSGAGYHRNLVADARMFQDLAFGKNRLFTFRERLDPILTVQAEQYSAQSARTRAFFCLLALLKPKYLDNGNEIPLGPAALSPASKTHRHHIFPRARLRQCGFSATAYNSLCNLCFLVAEDNQSIGSRLPSSYLADFKSIAKAQFSSAMKRHLIPVSADSGVWQPGVKSAYKQFRTERLKLICREFEKAAGIKIFQKD